jgi:hypothetical protein
MHHFWFSKVSNKVPQHHKALDFSGFEERILSSPQTEPQLCLAAYSNEKDIKTPAKQVWLGHNQTAGG